MPVLQEIQVQSLVRELRSHKPCGSVKKIKIKILAGNYNLKVPEALSERTFLTHPVSLCLFYL